MPGSSIGRKAKQALERALGLPGALGPTPEQLEMGRRLDAILEGLSDAQQEHVLKDLDDPEVMTSRLTREVLALAIGTEKPAVMHPQVAQVYLDHPDASVVHDCEDCGLGIPGHTGIQRGREVIPFRRYFDRCPNCGGRVGYAAYYYKRVMPLDRLRANAESARRMGYMEVAENYERMIADREREAT